MCKTTFISTVRHSFSFCWHYKPLWGLIFWASSYHVFLSLTRYVQFFAFSFLKSFNTSSLHLFLGVLWSSFLTLFVFSIPLRYPHHFILCALVYLPYLLVSLIFPVHHYFLYSILLQFEVDHTSIVRPAPLQSELLYFCVPLRKCQPNSQLSTLASRLKSYKSHHAPRKCVTLN